ncbi:hypothetical protein EE612_005000, partial [Oryza sativa]
DKIDSNIKIKSIISLFLQNS